MKSNSGDSTVNWAFKIYSLLGYLFLYLPILVVVIFSFNDSRFVESWKGFTLDWYGRAWTDPNIQAGLRNSLIVAPFVMVLSVILGTLLAIGLKKTPGAIVALFLAVMYMTIVSPEIVTGLASLLFFVQAGKALAIKNILGIPTIVVTQVVYTASLVALIVRARLAGMDDTLDEASADLGATPWTTFWSVTIPLLMPAIISGGLLAFTFAFDDFVITQFVSGPASSTLPIRIWGMVRFGVSPIVNPVATVILAFTLTSVFLAQYILTNENASTRPLVLWVLFIAGVVLYGVGPAQSIWTGLTTLTGVIGILTFLVVWMGALIGIYYLARRVRRPPPAAQLQPVTQ